MLTRVKLALSYDLKFVNDTGFGNQIFCFIQKIFLTPALIHIIILLTI